METKNRQDRPTHKQTKIKNNSVICRLASHFTKMNFFFFKENFNFIRYEKSIKENILERYNNAQVVLKRKLYLSAPGNWETVKI
jgi:hypothetical protein